MPCHGKAPVHRSQDWMSWAWNWLMPALMTLAFYLFARPSAVERTHSLAFGPLRRYALALLTGCGGGAANFLREQIKAARTNTDLARLRSAIFECITMQLGESEAMARIRSFDGSL
jgi:hypothetical protein